MIIGFGCERNNLIISETTRGRGGGGEMIWITLAKLVERLIKILSRLELTEGDFSNFQKAIRINNVISLGYLTLQPLHDSSVACSASSLDNKF